MASGIRTTRSTSEVVVDDFDEDFLNESLAILCEKSSWKVSKVTPLQNLQYSVVKLKQYAAKVKQALSCSVSEVVSVRYKAVFEVENNLRFSNDDPGAIHVLTLPIKKFHLHLAKLNDQNIVLQLQTQILDFEGRILNRVNFNNQQRRRAYSNYKRVSGRCGVSELVCASSYSISPDKYFLKKVDDESTDYKLSYEGVLMSWGVYLKDAHSIHLPFLFDRGQQTILKPVRQTLTKLFDCSITSFTFTQHHLLLFSGMLCQMNEISRTGTTLEFAYTTRDAIYRQKMTIQWEVEKMNKIWNSTCRGLLPAPLTYEQKLKCAFTTYKMFQNQIFRTFSLDLSMLDLIEVTYPKVSVKSGGYLRVRDEETAKCLLNVLNDLLLNCVDKFSNNNKKIGLGTLRDFHNR